MLDFALLLLEQLKLDARSVSTLHMLCDGSIRQRTYLQEVFKTPVKAADGQVYEKQAIQDWLARSDISPWTNLDMPNKNLRPLPEAATLLRKLVGTLSQKGRQELRLNGQCSHLFC